MPIVSISINYASLAQLNTGTSTVLSIQPAVLKSFFSQGSSMYALSLKGATFRGTGTHAGSLSITGDLVVGTDKFVSRATLGRVGINTPNPSVALDIAYVTNTDMIYLNNTSTNRAAIISLNAGVRLYSNSNSNDIQIRDSSATTVVNMRPVTRRVGILRTPTTYPLEVNGTCTATSFEGDGANLTGLLPIGTIMDFAGTSGQIPSGWKLCDGTSASGFPSLVTLLQNAGYPYGGSGANPNVPDLRGRTTVAAGGSYAVGGSGGLEAVVVTSTQSALPSHSHNISWQRTPSDNRFRSSPYAFGSPGHVSGSNPAENASASHTNLQPFLVVNKIIRGA